MYKIPKSLQDLLLRYVKKRYMPEKRVNPKTADQFTNYDIEFFARGVAEMSEYFTSERSSLPKNYLNKKELRAGYILYFVMSNFLKVKFCLDEIAAKETFADYPLIKIADIGCGPGTVTLAAIDYFRDLKGKIDLTALDQNTNALHDLKSLFKDWAGNNASLSTIYSYLQAKNLSHSLKGKYNLIIAANFFSEIGDVPKQHELAQMIVDRHLEDSGYLIIIEPSLRFTTRNLMKLRDSIAPDVKILAPCLHNFDCPMLKENNRDWCHMYLDWDRPEAIEKIDRLIGNRKEYLKFSYMIFSKKSPTKQSPEAGHNLFRVVSAPMNSKGKTELLLCNETCKNKLFRLTRLDKDQSPQNKDYDSTMRGDLVSYSGPERLEKTGDFRIVGLSRNLKSGLSR